MIDKRYLKAGKAVFTFANPDGVRYTYSVRISKDKKVWFVSLLTAPGQYTYMGLLRDGLQITKASKYTVESLPVKVFKYALQIAYGQKPLLPNYFLEHEGQCGRCGRELTTPDSIKAGFGPYCLTKV